MILNKEGVKFSAKQAAARMIWTAIRSFNDQPVTAVSLYEEAGFNQAVLTDREETLVQTQIDKLSARVSRLLKLDTPAPTTTEVDE